MKKELLRALALILLLLAFITLSGIGATASLLIENGQQAACCDHTGTDGAEQQNPCPGDDCSCCQGVTLLQPQQADIRQLITSPALPPEFTDSLKASVCDHSIEYPPEFA